MQRKTDGDVWELTAAAIEPVALPDCARAGSAKVWKIAPQRVAVPLERLLAVLDDAERERARRKRTAAARHAYAVAHAALRELLAAELGGDPRDVALARRSPPYGKPVLAGPPTDLTFNLSHTRGLILLALARGREVGVDVEWLGRPVRAGALARRYFTAAERSELATAPDSERERRFLQLWTRREAHAKMTGEGLRRAVSEESGAAGPFGGASSSLCDLDLAPAHVGALALQVDR